MRREVGDLTRGLRAVGATELGRVMVAGFLQSWSRWERAPSIGW
jgi:hypothetical protein